MPGWKYLLKYFIFFQCCLVKWPGFWITSWVSVPTFSTSVVSPLSSGCLKSVKKWWSFMKELQVLFFFKINIFKWKKNPDGSWFRKLSLKVRFWQFLITMYGHLGSIHKLRKHVFRIFWPPICTYFCSFGFEAFNKNS